MQITEVRKNCCLCCFTISRHPKLTGQMQTLPQMFDFLNHFLLIFFIVQQQTWQVINFRPSLLSFASSQKNQCTQTLKTIENATKLVVTHIQCKLLSTQQSVSQKIDTFLDNIPKISACCLVCDYWNLQSCHVELSKLFVVLNYWSSIQCTVSDVIWRTRICFSQFSVAMVAKKKKTSHEKVKWLFVLSFPEDMRIFKVVWGGETSVLGFGWWLWPLQQSIIIAFQICILGISVERILHSNTHEKPNKLCHL